MLALNEVTFEFGSRILYDQVSWHIKPKEKIGLIGANGTGKTTLLKVLVGDFKPSSGTVSKSKTIKIGYLNQDLLSIQSEHSILHVAMEAFERQNTLHDEIEGLLKKIETDYSDSLLNKLSAAQEEFELLDGYRIQYKAEEILLGLGFTVEQTAKPLKEFSGGWRMRVMLAKILLQQPDLLLLDEPTNHLDLPSIQWLENYLNNFEGAIVIVSHDRYFLDRTVNKIVESRNSNLYQYAGNYSFYLEEKQLREEIQKGEFKNQQQKIKQEERLIERFRAKASKAKMVQSRIKALNRMEKVEDVDSDAPEIFFNFHFSKQSGRFVVTLKNISKAYPGLQILSQTEAEIEKGDKIALIGANGKGKSSLLRVIDGNDAFEGESLTGHNVVKSFFAQHQLESLTLENTLLEELQKVAPSRSETELRSLLGCFLFTGDDVFKKIKVLSGGEKSRVALAKTLTSDANFLILDEPTNHLDIQSVNILVQALKQFEGTFIAVSHDRFFLSEVANKIWYLEDKKIKVYPGTYEEYELWRAAQEAVKVVPQSMITTSAAPVKSSTAKKPHENTNHTDKAKALKKLNSELTALESSIQLLDKEKLNLEDKLSAPSVFQDHEKIKSLKNSLQATSEKLTDFTKAWEVLAEKILESEAAVTR